MRFHEHFTQEELAILRVRAERLAASDTDRNRVEYPALRVMIGHEQYALPVTTLVAVYKRVSIVPVPCTPAHILGVTNVRGHVIPVLGLSHLLGVSSQDIETHVIVTIYKETAIGIAVSQVGDIMNYADEDITPLTAETHRWIRGVLMDGTSLVDMNALLGDPSLLVHDAPLT